MLSLPTIETILPSPTNTLATNYPGLIVRTQFEKESVTSYQWINAYADNSNIPQFYVHPIGCVPRKSINEIQSCVEINGVITSNLTYLQPLTTNLDLSVRSGTPAGGDFSMLPIVVALPRVTVQDCYETREDDVTVQSNSAGYNDVGTFTCSNNGRLFYSNGSQPTSHRTTCQYNAEWSGQDNLQCWAAPSPVITTMNGDFTVVEGNDFTVTCEYNDVIPIGTNTAFYLDGNEVGRQQERSFIFSLRAEDNNKQVSCQAVTPYTEMFTESGRSPNYPINVQYISSLVVNNVFSSKYMIDIDSGYLLRSDQNLSMNCSSQGNPTPQCAFTICSGECENITNINNECFISQPLSVGGSVSCLAVNNAGSRRSKVKNIAIVPEIRDVILSNAANVIENKTLTVRREEDLTLTCSISYGTELSTTYEWTAPNMIVYSSSVLNIPSLSAFDIGSYSFDTDDVFGDFNKTLHINVIYAPFQETSTLCFWDLDQSGSCDVTFMSNPQAEFKSLIKDNSSEVKVEYRSLIDDGFFQTFLFVRDQVTQSDNGTYTLYLQSTVEPYNHTITFDVIVKDLSDGPTTSTVAIALGVTVGVLVILLVAIGVVLRKRKATNQMKGNESSNAAYAYAVEDKDGYVDFREALKTPMSVAAQVPSHNQSPTQKTGEHNYEEISSKHRKINHFDQNVVFSHDATAAHGEEEYVTMKPQSQ